MSPPSEQDVERTMALLEQPPLPIEIRRRTDGEERAYAQGFLAGLAAAAAGATEGIARAEQIARTAFALSEAGRTQTTIDDHLEGT